MKKLTTKELREILNQEATRFINYTAKEIESYIKHNYECSYYTVKTLAKEFACR